MLRDPMHRGFRNEAFHEGVGGDPPHRGRLGAKQRHGTPYQVPFLLIVPIDKTAEIVDFRYRAILKKWQEQPRAGRF
jgi:hypothetical protein